MFKKHMSKVTTLLVLFVFGNMAAFANDIPLSWHRTQNTTTSDTTITGWHTDGTNKLCQDDDGAGSVDVSCDSVLVKSGSTDTNWTYTGGNDAIGNEFEMSYCFLAMAQESENCTAVTSYYGNILGATSGAWIIVVGSPNNANFFPEFCIGVSPQNVRVTYS